MTAYAYVCECCDHAIAVHALVGAGVAGPYSCRECGCQIMQDAPMAAYTLWQWRQRPELARSVSRWMPGIHALRRRRPL